MIIPERPPKSSEAGFWKPELDARFGGETARHVALRWVVRLRYGVLAGEIALIAALSLGLQISLPVLLIAPAIGLQVLSNWLLGSRMDRLGGNAEHLVGALFCLDTLCLTLILALSGGPANPFSLLYLVQITFSAVVLRKWWTWTLGVTPARLTKWRRRWRLLPSRPKKWSTMLSCGFETTGRRKMLNLSALRSNAAVRSLSAWALKARIRSEKRPNPPNSMRYCFRSKKNFRRHNRERSFVGICPEPTHTFDNRLQKRRDLVRRSP